MVNIVKGNDMQTLTLIDREKKITTLVKSIKQTDEQQ